MTTVTESHVQSRLSSLRRALDQIDDTPRVGTVSRLVGLTIEANGPWAEVGELVEIAPPGRKPLLAEVVGFRGNQIIMMPLGEMHGVGPGTPVYSIGRELRVQVGQGLLGRVLDGLGRPIDGLGPLVANESVPVHRAPLHPMERLPIEEPLSLGVRSIDGLITCGKGQRLGIFAGSGVGKSTLLGMLARGGAAEVNVIALIGERGREVKEFLERDLGPDGLRRSVVIVATSDQPAMVRLKGAFVATAIAEYFRDQGRDVLLLMDSVTRFAAAQREVGLAAGEPPATKGYTPSVFSLLPKLLERTGRSTAGTITGLYTVLVDGDDLTEPIADAVRSILDGHIVLSRRLAERSHYPAVDVLASVSRSMLHIVSPEHRQAAARMRELMAAYREAEDLINIGAYVKGNNPLVDKALEKLPQIEGFLRQEVDEAVPIDETVSRLIQIVST